MINPQEFIKQKQDIEEEGFNVSGTFICQECLEPAGNAILDEDEMILRYACKNGHINEATL